MEYINAFINLPEEEQERIIEANSVLNISKYNDSNSSEDNFCIDYEIGSIGIHSQKAVSEFRNFNQSPTVSEVKDIRYIVTSLANKSLATLLKQKSDLKKAGKRIDSIHPLKIFNHRLQR